MTAVIAMLRGVNLARHNRIKMEELRALCTSLKLRDPQTYVQSGNVIFSTREPNLVRLSKRIEKAIEEKCGFRTDVIVRTAAEMRDVIARNPFAKRNAIEPGKFLVLFLRDEPGPEVQAKARNIKADPEQLRLHGREVYIYFPNGMGRSKLSTVAIERALETPGTGRNWNSVTKMLAMAEKIDAA
jgi:uncharacterized protein (DUF1697 family)